MFVLGRPFQPGLLFMGEAKSLSKSGALEKCFALVDSDLTANIRPEWQGLPGINTLAYKEQY